MAKLGFTYEIDRCTGCKACQIACKDKHSLPSGDFYRRVELFAHGDEVVRFSGACNHCAQPACLAGCPAGALYHAADGTVQHHAGRCIGCGACVWNCPYGAPVLSATKGVSQKCDSCLDLRRQGRPPACVQACVTHCLSFGEVAEDEEGGAALPFLPDPARTRPSLRVPRRGQGGEAHE